MTSLARLPAGGWKGRDVPGLWVLTSATLRQGPGRARGARISHPPSAVALGECLKSPNWWFLR